MGGLNSLQNNTEDGAGPEQVLDQELMPEQEAGGTLPSSLVAFVVGITYSTWIIHGPS